MADTNVRLAELVAEMLVKQDQTNAVLREVVAILRDHTDILKTHTRILNEHTGILNDHTRIMNEHTQRLDKIEKYLSERVPHFGEDITIETKNGPFTGLLRKAV